MNREILRLALPNILSNLSVPLLSTVDTLLMGRLSIVHIGAVGIGSMIFNFVYWNFGFLRMGTTGITAQAFGANDVSEIIHSLARALLMALLLSSLVLLLQWPLGKLSFHLMNVEGEQYDLVKTYFDIRIWAAPATLALYALMGWFFGMQNAIYPLILTIFINIINIVVSYWLVWVQGMEVAGVAWGTVIAQYAGLLLAIALFLFKYASLNQHFQRKALTAIGAFQRFLEINGNLFLRTLCLTFAFGFFYSRSALEGITIVAVNTVLQQFISWMSYGIDGFAYAAESLVGKYKGANNSQKLDQSIRYSFYWGMGLALLFSLVFYLFSVPLLQIFSDQEALIQAANIYLIWVIIFPIAATPCYIWDGIFIGLTASKAMRNSMIISLLVYLLIYYSFQSAFGNHGLWLALLLFMVARGAFQWYLFRKGELGA